MPFARIVSTRRILAFVAISPVFFGAAACSPVLSSGHVGAARPVVHVALSDLPERDPAFRVPETVSGVPDDRF